MHLSRFNRVRLAYLPTPLEPMHRLSELLGGPNLWVKRDDCTGLSTGGNKTRKLEFLMADAITRDADTIITQGATQSNHARQTAAAAAKLGMQCHILLEDRTGRGDFDYKYNGNVLLDQLHGSTISMCAADTDMNAAMEVLAEQLAAAGRKPYVIPGGGSNEIGALGYVNAAVELLYQANDKGLRINHVVHATGSTGTQAGLVLGLQALNSGIPVYGISVRSAADVQQQMVYELISRTAEYMQLDRDTCGIDAVMVNSDYVGEGYGVPTNSMLEAVKMLAATEGILLDPVYTGKGMAGLIGLIRNGYFKKGDNVVFLHTGGNTALFGYPDIFSLPGYSS